MPLLICNHLRDKETTKDFQLGSQHDGTRPARRPGGLPPGLDRSGRPSKGRERGARGGREALGSRAAAVCVRRRWWRIFSSFSCQGPSSPAIGGSTLVLVAVRSGDEGHGGQRWGKRRRVRHCVSLLNRNRRLSSELLADPLSFRSEFFFLMMMTEVTSVSHTHASRQRTKCVRNG